MCCVVHDQEVVAQCCLCLGLDLLLLPLTVDPCKLGGGMGGFGAADSCAVTVADTTAAAGVGAVVCARDNNSTNATLTAATSTTTATAITITITVILLLDRHIQVLTR